MEEKQTAGKYLPCEIVVKLVRCTAKNKFTSAQVERIVERVEAEAVEAVELEGRA